MSVEKHGDGVSSLIPGASLAHESRKSDHTIEACWLFKRLVAISKRHFGPENQITKGFECGLLQCKTSYVGLSNRGLFEVLRYKGDKHVVRGPDEVAEEIMVTMRVDAIDVVLQPNGAPVVCHGLKNNAAYLNGKIGEIRSFDRTAMRYGVYFEDESIKPKSVKPRNLNLGKFSEVFNCCLAHII
jgi:hypothetical protein